jgi:hypothetical protein
MIVRVFLHNSIRMLVLQRQTAQLENQRRLHYVPLAVQLLKDLAGTEGWKLRKKRRLTSSDACSSKRNSSRLDLRV